MRSAVWLLMLTALMAGAQPVTKAPPADADSSRQSPEAQAVNPEPSLRPLHIPGTLCRSDSSWERASCIAAAEVLDAIKRGRPCDETAPYLAIGFVLTICALLVLSGIVHH